MVCQVTDVLLKNTPQGRENRRCSAVLLCIVYLSPPGWQACRLLVRGLDQPLRIDADGHVVGLAFVAAPHLLSPGRKDDGTKRWSVPHTHIHAGHHAAVDRDRLACRVSERHADVEDQSRLRTANRGGQRTARDHRCGVRVAGDVPQAEA